MHTVRKTLFFPAVFLFLLFISCHQPDALQENTERIADLECRAITLRKHRFALADSIRFAQDTLLHLKSNTDSVRLAQQLTSLNIQKDILLQNSLRLADSLRIALDSLRKYTFTNSKDRKHFDETLKEILQEKDCEAN